MATLHKPVEGVIPNIIIIGVPDVEALHRVQAKLKAYQIPHYAWTEPDYDLGFTSIATGVLSEEQKLPLKNYRLWNAVNNTGAEQVTACRVMPDAPTNTPIV